MRSAWRAGVLGIVAAIAVVCALVPVSAQAAELKEAQDAFKTGQYEDAVQLIHEELSEEAAGTEGSILLVRSLLRLGRNEEALAAITAAVAKDSRSIRLRWAGREVALASGLTEKASEWTSEIPRIVSDRPWQYREAADLVVYGRAALVLGADPKQVLDRLFAPAQKSAPELRDVYLARGEVALEKQDYALAGRAFDEGLKRFPDDPDFQVGRARAYASGDRAVMAAALEAALKTNSRHGPALLLMAERQITAEDYDAARKTLTEVLAVNPHDPEAWALRAVIAHLTNDPAGEKAARSSGLRTWAKNPRVDHVIGKLLSQKYRFAEGAAYQRQALVFDPNYLPAEAQLSSDLLRLGDDDGWRLAKEVNAKDGYNVEAFNLVTLQETMAGYATLQNDNFLVRMSGHEAAVYGPRVMALLMRAKAQLCDKYGIEIAKPTIVEVFADTKDFAVRTFGMPDVAGFLGVCFGRVVTANSPAANGGQPVNWESVLWHEFCHVVTLQLTRNKMPRWLSEGISVYEERQADPVWGMRMDARNRQMIVDGELTPVGQLSGAFMAPKTSGHLQFAYFQSSLVVEFIIERFGLEKLRAVLRDLREGVEINAALAKHTVPLATLEKDFDTYAHAQAEALAPKLDWAKPEPSLLLPGRGLELAAWNLAHQDNYWILLTQGKTLVEEKKWDEAEAKLKRLLERYPEPRGGDNPYRSLAAVYRARGDVAGERAALTKLAALDDEASDAHLRLMELAQAAKDWAAVAHHADRYLGINPLAVPPYRYLAEASAARGDDPTAVTAYRAMLALDPDNPADTHYNLGRLLHKAGDPGGRRHVLQALEEAPRYRAALMLLAEINSAAPDGTAGAGERTPVLQ